MKKLVFCLPAIVILGCTEPAEGPLKGVLVVYSVDAEYQVDTYVEDLQIYIETVTEEPVFDFSFASMSEFTGTLRNRRTILFLTESSDEMPDPLRRGEDGVYRGTDIWARGQSVLGIVIPDGIDPEYASSLLEEIYNGHMFDYVYGSFVATQMSSPDRIDSLLAFGFSIDIPKSYQLESWCPEEGFIQYQRQASDNCLLMISLMWNECDTELTLEDIVLRREAMARTFFYDASADSVDREKVTAIPLDLNSIQGWRLTGVWRNPEHLNAGAFTSYILDHGGCCYILDMEIYNPGRGKEPYIREGWTIMNSFVLED